MASEGLRARARGNVEGLTAVLSLVGYALVAGVFTGALPLPDLTRGTTLLLGDLIALVNALALACLLAGVTFVKRRQYRRHRYAMLAAFILILAFLAMYLLKVGGGFEKSLVVAEGQFLAGSAETVRATYLAMLAVHVLLSVVSVPVVLYAVLLGLTHTTAELRGTRKATVGRIAAGAWILSLALGILTYLLLNHVYGWEPLHRSALVLVAAGRRW